MYYGSGTDVTRARRVAGSRRMLLHVLYTTAYPAASSGWTWHDVTSAILYVRLTAKIALC